jgi:hypothetical protein
LDVFFDWKTFRGTQSSWKELAYFERPQDKPYAEGRDVIQGACAWGSICNASAGMGRFVPQAYGDSPWAIFALNNDHTPGGQNFAGPGKFHAERAADNLTMAGPNTWADIRPQSNRSSSRRACVVWRHAPVRAVGMFASRLGVPAVSFGWPLSSAACRRELGHAGGSRADRHDRAFPTDDRRSMWPQSRYRGRQ